MLLPALATIIVGARGLAGHMDAVDQADYARTLANFNAKSSTLLHQLQEERAKAVMVFILGGGQATRQTSLSAYDQAAGGTDEALAGYLQQAQLLPTATLSPKVRDALDGATQGLAELGSVRNGTKKAKSPLSEVLHAYNSIIINLLIFRDLTSQFPGDVMLSQRIWAGVLTGKYQEVKAQKRVVILLAFAQGSMSKELSTQYIATVMNGKQLEDSAIKLFVTDDELKSWNEHTTGPASAQLEADQHQIESMSGSSRMADLNFTVQEWEQTNAEAAELFRGVQEKIDADAVMEATHMRDEATRQVLIETGVLLGMLLLAALFAWLLARSMARSLRELRHGALAVAQYGLPQAVARLRDPSISSQLSPAQIAGQIADPLPVRSRDEFGQVTEAFNAVHLEAVRTAAEQAALRASVGTMFVNLARRSQILVDRLIGHLDRLERGEEDPDRLGELFQLDHLATRMRRNDENLLVLAGADSTRVQRDPASLVDVLRAAQSEVEHYTRIEFGTVDRDIEVASHAVNDLVHLVAELFDNATAFSPPDSIVMVEARRVGDRAVLYVEDQGIGISNEMLADINERLATPPLVDVAVSRMMGLVVVARLAARHAVKVELRPASDRGTIADVTLSQSVLVPRALAGRGQAPNRAIPQQPQPAQVPPRSPFATPLALEGGYAPRPSAPAVPARPQFDVPPQPSRLFEAPPAPPGPVVPKTVTNGRAMPAWSDLTGVNGRPPSPMNGSAAPVEPLPQRRAADQGTVEGELMSDGPAVPRQMPVSPEAALPPRGPETTSAWSVSEDFAGGGRPVSGPPTGSIPVSDGPISGVPSPGSLPVWPPVAPPAAAPQATPAPRFPVEPVTVEHSQPDRRSEFPEAGLTNRPPAPQPTIAYVPPAPAMPERTVPPADETMELPIFRELESAWFRTRKPAASESAEAADASLTAQLPRVQANAGTATGQYRTVRPADAMPTGQFPTVAGTGSRNGADQQRSSTMADSAGMAGTHTAGDRPNGGPAGYTVPAPYTPSWQTAADDGWAAASALAAASNDAVSETTGAGLPKRVPMAQLVPGGVDKGATTVQRRTPEGVRGLLSAYHRGVQRGRTQQKDDDSTAGSDPNRRQPGKEHEA